MSRVRRARVRVGAAREGAASDGEADRLTKTAEGQGADGEWRMIARLLDGGFILFLLFCRTTSGYRVYRRCSNC